MKNVNTSTGDAAIAWNHLADLCEVIQEVYGIGQKGGCCSIFLWAGRTNQIAKISVRANVRMAQIQPHHAAVNFALTNLF